MLRKARRAGSRQKAGSAVIRSFHLQRRMRTITQSLITDLTELRDQMMLFLANSKECLIVQLADACCVSKLSGEIKHCGERLALDWLVRVITIFHGPDSMQVTAFSAMS
jgi:hypothetical protein